MKPEIEKALEHLFWAIENGAVCPKCAAALALLREELEREPRGFHDVEEFYPEEKELTIDDWKARAEKAEGYNAVLQRARDTAVHAFGEAHDAREKAGAEVERLTEMAASFELDLFSARQRAEKAEAERDWKAGRVIELEAELAAARPLLEAAMKWDTYAGIKNWGALADAATAYKEAKEKP